MVEQKMFEEKMFADSLLETSWAQRTRRGWTTLTSFGVQAVVVGLLLLLPLLKTVGLPSTRPISTPISVGLPAVEPAAPRPPAAGASVVVSNYDKGRLMMPKQVPPLIQPGVDETSAQGPGGPDVDVIGTGPGPGLPNGLLLPFRDGTNLIVLPKPAPITRAIRTSIMQEGNLIRRLQPIYPYAAKVAHVQGQVVLAAIISKAGTIENLRALSGHPLLVGAAIDAVSQWRYRPYILNNEPVEVETQITVNFTLSGN